MLVVLYIPHRGYIFFHRAVIINSHIWGTPPEIPEHLKLSMMAIKINYASILMKMSMLWVFTHWILMVYCK